MIYFSSFQRQHLLCSYCVWVQPTLIFIYDETYCHHSVYVYRCVKVCVCMLRPEIYIKCLPLLFLNLELIYLSRLAWSSCSKGSLSSSFPVLGFQVHNVLPGFLRHLSSVPPDYMRHTTKSSPSSMFSKSGLEWYYIH